METIKRQVRIMGLLLRYVYLHVRYVYLIICYCLLRIAGAAVKVAGAALVEAAKLECYIRFLSREERVIFAACFAVSIYILALVLFIRI